MSQLESVYLFVQMDILEIALRPFENVIIHHLYVGPLALVILINIYVFQYVQIL